MITVTSDASGTPVEEAPVYAVARQMARLVGDHGEWPVRADEVPIGGMARQP
jgi:hypothetical protein